MPPVYLRIEPIRLKPAQRLDNRYKVFEKEMILVLKAVARVVQREMERAQGKWDHKVTIRVRAKQTPRQYRVDIGPFGHNKRYWIFVSAGIAGRYIAPKRYGYLNIKKGYLAHTSPMGNWHGSGTYRGPFYRVRRPVWWPGIEARNFEHLIIKWHGKHIIAAVMATVFRHFRS